MKFDYKAYGKVFPVQKPGIITDSAVDGYNPTADEANGSKANDIQAITPDNQPENGAQPDKMEENVSSGTNEPKSDPEQTTGEIQP